MFIDEACLCEKEGTWDPTESSQERESWRVFWEPIRKGKEMGFIAEDTRADWSFDVSFSEHKRIEGVS